MPGFSTTQPTPSKFGRETDSATTSPTSVSSSGCRRTKPGARSWSRWSAITRRTPSSGLCPRSSQRRRCGTPSRVTLSRSPTQPCSQQSEPAPRPGSLPNYWPRPDRSWPRLTGLGAQAVTQLHAISRVREIERVSRLRQRSGGGCDVHRSRGLSRPRCRRLRTRSGGNHRG